MKYTNSSLVKYTKISPNKTVNRNHAIDTITIHCVVGQCAIESLGTLFSNPSLEASSNYGIGYDGKIGMFVEEKDRSWCSSSASNDNRAITIECASDSTSPYAINSKVYDSLIKLCADICKRNNIKELKWKGDKSLIGQVDKQNMTVHRWFANKSCPGDYIYNRLGQIAKEVNAILKPSVSKNEETTKALYRVRKTWTSSSTQKGAFSILENAKDCADKYPGYSVFDEKGKKLYTSKEAFKPYIVEVTVSDLNIRKGPGTNYSTTGKYTGKGKFTIVEESKGTGSAKGWGKLKSGLGWISLDYVKKI